MTIALADQNSHGNFTTPLARFLWRTELWRRLAIAMALGALASLSMPPLGVFLVLVIAFPGYHWLMCSAPTAKAAFFTGWGFSFGFLAMGLYWVAFSMTVDPVFYWMIPFAVVGLPALLALFHGAGAVLWFVQPRRGLAGVVLLALLWSLSEFARGTLFTGFPWHLIGYTWTGWLPMLQTASLIGVYGLSLLTVLVAILPAAWFTPLGRHQEGLVTFLASLLILAGLAGWGAWRLDNTSDQVAPDVTLRLVQPNISQRDKWNPELWSSHFELHLALSREANMEGAPVPTHIIWPETALPFFLDREPHALAAIAELAAPDRLVLTGVPRREVRADGEWAYYNALSAIDGQGDIVASYDKHHLVPFGEYMPLREWLPIEPVAGQIDYTPGPGPQTLTVPGLPSFSPLVCYEAIFPGAATPRNDRPEWLLNVTNDAWFGQSAGPHQHFAIARTRAVEEGLPMIRVAATGVSGVVDAYGRVAGSIPLGERGILDASLPLPAPPTLFARIGNIGFMVLAIIFLGISLLIPPGRRA